MSAKSLGDLKSHLNHLTKFPGIADHEYWLRDNVGEDGLRRLYDADYINSEEFERWIGMLYALPGAV